MSQRHRWKPHAPRREREVAVVLNRHHRALARLRNPSKTFELVSRRSPANRSNSHPFLRKFAAPVLPLSNPAGAGDRLWTVREVAVALRICTATVYRICERGDIAYVRVSNAIRIPAASLAEYAGRSR